MKFGWKMRVALVLSAVWLCLVFLVADEYQRIGQIIGFGCLPLVIFWGIAWAFTGWRAQLPAQPKAIKVVNLEKKQRRSNRIRTLIAVISIIAIGLFLASRQFQEAGNKSGGDSVGFWFGEWLVYGIFVYLIARFIPRAPYGLPIILASLAVVGGVNYKTYTAINEERKALTSLAKSAPLIIKIQSGVKVSEQEVKDANVGMMQPIVMALASYSREMVEISNVYTKAISRLQLDQMLSPKSLASSDIRLRTRANLKVWHQTTTEYKIQVDAAIARGKLGIKAAQSQMSPALSSSATKGFEESSTELSTYVSGLVTNGNEAGRVIKDVLDLMDNNVGKYVIDKGPPVTLLFSDEIALLRYRQLMNHIVELGEMESEAQARLLKKQVNLTDKMTKFLENAGR